MIGVVISLIFSIWRCAALTGEAWQSFRQANYIYLVPALLLLVVINWVRAYRWRLLMGNARGIEPQPGVLDRQHRLFL